MELFINNEKASFELEDEKNSYAVIMALNDFVSSQTPQQFISNVRIDGKEYSMNDEENLKQLEVDKIKTIEIETNDIYGITRLTLFQIGKFLLVLKDIFHGKEILEKLNEIKDSVAWMKNGINKILQIFNINNNEKIKEQKKAFGQSCEALTGMIEEIKKNGIRDVQEVKHQSGIHIENLAGSLLSIKKWLVFSCSLPDKEFVLENINKILENINKIIPSLSNVPILFQTGDDKEAMNIIHFLSAILEDSIELFMLFKESFKLHLDGYTVKEVNFEEFFRAITAKLKELIDAIEKNDSVMVSDLLEYEFIPNIEEIHNIISRIKNEAFEKMN